MHIIEKGFLKTSSKRIVPKFDFRPILFNSGFKTPFLKMSAAQPTNDSINKKNLWKVEYKICYSW